MMFNTARNVLYVNGARPDYAIPVLTHTETDSGGKLKAFCVTLQEREGLQDYPEVGYQIMNFCMRYDNIFPFLVMWRW